MLLITGAAGFIAGNLIQRILQISNESIIAVDNFHDLSKKSRVEVFGRLTLVDRAALQSWLSETNPEISAVFHLGARTDTTEKDEALLTLLNTVYTQELFNYCTKKQIPILYSSSAATYGSGSFGFSDDEQFLNRLNPQNPYAVSKHKLDLWVQNQPSRPPQWYGLKFFNVYGYGEASKQKMASMVFHAFHQIYKTGEIKLFKSEKIGIKHGEQRRDFVFIDDIIDVMIWLWKSKPQSGIYNVGSGISRTFLDLVNCVFKSMNLPPKVSFINVPVNLKHHYQYYTCAEIHKLEKAGYQQSFTSLESGVPKYIDVLFQEN